MRLEAIKRVEWIARRAPSAHNTQPWRLIETQDGLRLDFDPERALPASDPTRRDLFLSMGAFAESLLIVANDSGAPLRFEPDISEKDCRVGWFWAARTPYQTPFARRDLLARRTSRLSYAPFAFNDASRARVQEWAGASDRLCFLRGGEIADLARRADVHFFSSPAAAGEFLLWIRRNDDAQDGLSAACLGLSRAEADLLAWLLSSRMHAWTRRLGGAHLLASAAGGLAKGAQLIALVGEGEAPEDVVLSGGALMRMWLGLSRMGLYTQPLSQILDCTETERRLAARLGLAGGERLRCLFRFGPSPAPPRSRRLGETLVSMARDRDITANEHGRDACSLS